MHSAIRILKAALTALLRYRPTHTSHVDGR